MRQAYFRETVQWNGLGGTGDYPRVDSQGQRIQLLNHLKPPYRAQKSTVQLIGPATQTNSATAVHPSQQKPRKRTRVSTDLLENESSDRVSTAKKIARPLKRLATRPSTDLCEDQQTRKATEIDFLDSRDASDTSNDDLASSSSDDDDSSSDNDDISAALLSTDENLHCSFVDCRLYQSGWSGLLEKYIVLNCVNLDCCPDCCMFFCSDHIGATCHECRLPVKEVPESVRYWALDSPVRQPSLVESIVQKQTIQNTHRPPRRSSAIDCDKNLR